MLLVLASSCLCAIYWSQMLSREWRCSWSNADRRCSNYIWVINNLVAFESASYIRDLTVMLSLSQCVVTTRRLLGSWSSQGDVIKWKHFPGYWPFVREFPGDRWILRTKPKTQNFDVSFDLRLNGRLSKQSWGWWFETPSRPLWRHNNGALIW